MRIAMTLTMAALFIAACPADAANPGASLYNAAQTGDLTQVQRLLRQGEPTDYRTDGWRTPLHTAAFNGHTEVVIAILEAGAEVDADDKDWWTPLHLAAQNGHTDVVNALLAAGADPDAQTRKDSTPLDLALRRSQLEAARSLAVAGESLDAWRKDWTRLAGAVWRNETDRVALLLELGADTERAIRDGRKPLYIATKGPAQLRWPLCV